MPPTRTAIIVGGGIAGPVAAMALQAAGIEATVYESYGDPADASGPGASGPGASGPSANSPSAGGPSANSPSAGGPSANSPGAGGPSANSPGAAGTPENGSVKERIGGGMSIAPNGMNALAVLGLDDAVRRVSRPIRSMLLQSATGKRLAEFGTPAGLPPMAYVWRDDVYRVLHDAAQERGIRIEHGRRLTGFAERDGCVTAVFSDGTGAEADVLIGADGIRSTVRRLIDPGAPEPGYAGLVSVGAPVRDTGVAATGDAMHMVFGRRAFLGYQVFDDGDGVWFVNLPHPAPMTVAEARAIPAGEWLRTVRNAVADDRSPGTALLDRTDPAKLVVVGPMETIGTVSTWHRGRAVLVGDSVHAPSSSSGQGASLAIESAVQLGRCLRDLPYTEAFETYERLRRPRVEKIIAMAARTNSDKAAGPVGRVVRDLVMPLAMKFVKPEKLAWQYDYQIDWADNLSPKG